MTRPALVAALAFLALAVGCREPTAPTDGGVDGGVGDRDASPGDVYPPDGGFRWPVPTEPVQLTPSDAWKTRISPSDRFVRDPEQGPTGIVGSPRWVKFAVLMRDPSRVFFQDSNRYPFHYEMISGHLDPYRGQSRAEIDRVTLHEFDQALILGAVLFPPGSTTDELGIQLVRQDAYHPEMARAVLELVRSSIDTSTTTRAFYFPTYEQAAAARADGLFFERNGFPVSSPDRWGAAGACYAAGWALGRLVYVPTAEIDAAYGAGRLRAQDILLTDGVPAEVPFVAGIVSLEPGTPNSHVAILARSHGVPFAHVREPAQQRDVRALDGREVVVRADAEYGGCEVQVLDATGALTPTQRAELLALKAPEVLDFPAKVRRGAIAASTEDLGPDDARFFGGKAANFGLLRDTIPGNSPSAIALSFDLWDAFMAQRLPDARTLAEAIRARLAPHTSGTDLIALRAALAEVRGLIQGASFTAEQQTAVIAALAPFDPLRRIRFRSSTNVEDGANFTGAGLYDSESGCLADDTDADTRGPSRCDATRFNERGVFRAIQRVYASFYADNAYLERLRRGVDEEKVGMGLLVHHSYVDEDELANGVATVTWGEFSQSVQMVTQLGAISVANPEGGARPEVVSAEVFGAEVYPMVRERSTLVQLGATVMTYPEDYEALVRLFLRVGERFAAQTGRQNFVLDLEYKRMRPSALVVKQVREVPRPGADPRLQPTFLLAGRQQLCTHQGESYDVFSFHRLKSRWDLSTRSGWLRAPDVQQTLFTEVTLELVDDGRVTRTTGLLTSRPDFSHRVDPQELVDRWAVPGANTRQVELQTTLDREVRAPASPIRTLRDGALSFAATWATPVFEVDFMGNQATRVLDGTRLDACPEGRVVDARHALVEREVTAGGKRVRTAFYWPEPPRGVSAGYTAPLYRWRETVLEGFTAQPIVLRGYWSQTYRPGHHNFSEDFIFEPRLEEGLAPAVVAELEAAGVRWIHVEVGEGRGHLSIMGVDGVYRRQ